MNIWEVIVLSVVQGATEWLPISSSGLLVLFEKYLVSHEVSQAFDVFLHLGSLFVLIIFFYKEIKEILLTGLKRSHDHDKKNWWWYILLSTIVTAGVGYIFYGHIDQFRTLDQIANWYFVTSALLLMTKFLPGGDKKITWWKALLIGLAQGLAVIPSLSRSGAVIAMAFVLKISKKDAFDYTFITAIPAIIGAFVLTVRDLTWEPIYLVAIPITMLVGYLSLGWLRRIVNRESLYLFFIFTLALGLIIKIL